MKMLLIRGLPGSGKSTLAKQLPGVHFEADDYFMYNGVYMFDAQKLWWVHQTCLSQVKWAMVAKFPDITVANTFTTVKEMKPYFALAKEFKYDVQVYECTGNYGSVHGVPTDTIERMRARWEKYNA